MMRQDSQPLLDYLAQLKKYSEDQPRDEHGMWTDGGGSNGGARHKEIGGTGGGPRPVHAIARDIQRIWSKQGKGVNYAAKPYLEAMHALSSASDMYGADSGHSVISYFLGNATAFRGPEAQKLKAELKAHLARR